MELYEPEARFVAPSGETVVGREHIRGAVDGLIQAQTRMESDVVQAIAVDDIALLYTNFQGTANDESGKRVAVSHRAVEVLRRHPDGTWKFIVGDPAGRATERRTLRF